MTAAPSGATEALVSLGGLELANALRSGIYRLLKHADHLNKINVFPVPDGDTGTNLSMTLRAVLAAIDREPPTHAGALLQCAADAALDGARGNSGAIFAQFLLGMADGAGSHAMLNADALAFCADTGARYARDAMSEPKDGTLLTVLRTFADATREAVRGNPSISPHAQLATSLPSIRITLAATATELEPMRTAHVVDAGAQGFVEWLEGLVQYLDTGNLEVPASAQLHDATAEPMANGMATTWIPGGTQADCRWCAECLVLAPSGGEGLDLRRLREQLVAHGNSVVVGGNMRKAKIHIHTADPDHVFALAACFGAVCGEKADDMRRQASAAHHARTRRVAIVSDSAADIPENLIDSLGIHVVPLRVHFGDRSYLDKVTLAPADFYRELARNPRHPKTSQPPPGDFRRAYEFLASHFEHVVSISMSSKVSGTYNAAVNAAQRVASAADGKPAVCVVDSGSVSCGEGLIAIAAAECAMAGGSVEAVVAAARAAATNTRAFALLASIDAAVKGGRVPPAVRRVANALNLSIVLATSPDGQVKPAGALWGRHRLIERFARYVAKRAPQRRVDADTNPPRLRVIIGHGNAAERGRELAEHLESALARRGVVRYELTDLGTALGVHGGPGTLVVGLQVS